MLQTVEKCLLNCVKPQTRFREISTIRAPVFVKFLGIVNATYNYLLKRSHEFWQPLRNCLTAGDFGSTESGGAF